MSLRLRLTLVYTSLMGGILLLVGLLVYGLVSSVLLRQVDDRLLAAAEQLVPRLRLTADGQFDPSAVMDFEPTENLLFQVWDNQGNLQLARPFNYTTPLTPEGWNRGENYFSTSERDGAPIRVFTVPLRTDRGPAGHLHLGLSLSLLVLTQRTLGLVLTSLILVAMVSAAVATWLITGRALAPLETVTQVATTITQADDLSRRIPETESPDSEVGRLITAFNETLERLERLFQAQKRFMADVSHELRTPLTVIKGEVGLMRRMGQGDAESLHSIEAEVDRLTRMVGDLLLLAQAESGRLPLDLRPFELDTVLLDVYHQMRLLAGDQLELTVDSIDQVELVGDRDRIKQVLLNLVSNAVQYTPKGGKVSISLSKTSEQAQLTISDSGPGIAPQDLPHIFERFYRAERSRSRKKGTGYGPGLSIAYWIVRSRDRVIVIESAEGQGATFRVSLPLASPGQEAELKPAG